MVKEFRIFRSTIFKLLGLLFAVSCICPDAEARCFSIFEIQVDVQVTGLPIFRDSRLILENLLRESNENVLKIGEGNSAVSYLFKDSSGEYKVAKVYKAGREEALERDHLGLRAVQRMFNLNSHNSSIRVATSEVVSDLAAFPGQSVLVMPHIEGLNLHSLLIADPPNSLRRQKAIELYNEMIRELDDVAQALGIRDEIRIESEKYFQDGQVDGLYMLSVNSKPNLLIKTDNVIFNPVDNSLTLIDPY